MQILGIYSILLYLRLTKKGMKTSKKSTSLLINNYKFDNSLVNLMSLRCNEHTTFLIIQVNDALTVYLIYIKHIHVM
jgi:hypothetical protein